MKRFLAVFLSLFMISGSVYAEIPAEKAEMSDELVTFIVEVEGEAALIAEKANAASTLEDKTRELLGIQDKIMSEIKGAVSKSAEKGFVYTALFNGFSVEAERTDLEEIKAIDGVGNVYVAEKIPIEQPTVGNASGLTAVSSAYDLGYGGEGQVIAVIDSGCDTEHDFFATPPKNPKYTKADIDKILKTRKLNSKTTSANQVYRNEKIPYAFNYYTGLADTYLAEESHGTHVSGIAAGKEGSLSDERKISGVAYDSQLVFMNASDGEYLREECILAAINDAALLEADVINMSFGSSYMDSSAKRVYTDVLKNAREVGISVIGSAGNSSRGIDDIPPLAENPDYSTGGTPSGYESVMSVASADNVKTERDCWVMKLGDDREVELFSCFEASTFIDLFTDGFVEYAYCFLGKEADFEGVDLTGKIALVDRGEITFAEKASNAKNAGAVGLIIANNDDVPFSTSALALPAATATKSCGKLLSEASDKMIKFVKNSFVESISSNGGKISYYSSWGVDSSLRLKPEITAPGGSICSSIPDNKYGYLSGTSMASPYVAGAMAVARQFYEENPYNASFNGLTGSASVDLLENVAMTSAEIIRYENGLPYSPRLQGAGLINLKNLLEAKVTVKGDGAKAKVSLGEIGDEFELVFTVTNISDEPAYFDKVSIELITDGYYEEDGEYYVDDSVSLKAESISAPENISIEAGGKYIFTATVKLDKEFLEENKKIFKNGFFVDGFAVLGTSGNSDYASVPFTGFYGDWNALPIFDTTTYDEGGSKLAMEGKPYNTGTFLKALIDDDYFYHVGRNSIKKEIGDKKYISFSSTGDLTLDLETTNYRAISKMLLEITDKNDNTVFSQEYNKICSKFYGYDFAFDKKKMSGLEEGEYTITASAVPVGGDTFADSLTLPLVIDNTPPEFVSAAFDEETKILTVSAKDNHYMPFFYYEYDDEGYGYAVITDEDISEDGTVTKTIDLSKAEELETVVVEVVDYAMNDCVRSLDVLVDSVGVEAEKLVSFDGLTSAKFLVRNNTDEAVAADIFVAFYDEASRLTAYSKKENIMLEANGEANVGFSMLADVKTAKSAKVFIWKHGSMIPVGGAKMFVLK